MIGIYYKVLAHEIIEAEISNDLQVRDLGKSVVQFKGIKFRGQLVYTIVGGGWGARAWRAEEHWWARSAARQMELKSTPPLPFCVQAPVTLGRVICFTQSTDSSASLFSHSNILADTPRNPNFQLSGQPIVQSSWYNMLPKTAIRAARQDTCRASLVISSNSGNQSPLNDGLWRPCPFLDA